MFQDDLNSEDLKQRKARARDWKMFRRNNMFTQKRLSEIAGICRRTIQLVENGYVTPHPLTLRRFDDLKRKYKANAELDLTA
jgi:DNA-binding XRE family transcriptional regulator